MEDEVKENRLKCLFRELWWYIDLYVWFPFKLHFLLGGAILAPRLLQLRYLNERYERIGKELVGIRRELDAWLGSGEAVLNGIKEVNNGQDR